MKTTTNLSLLGIIMLLPLLVWGQRAGDLDRSFNYGLGENYQFNRGYGTDYDVYQTVIQPDGKIILVGSFNYYNGIAKNRIARLNSDGTIDSSFNTGTGGQYAIYAVALQSDGKIIVGGLLRSFDNVLVNRIARLNNDGSIDSSFHPGTGVGGINNYLYNINIQSDGKIIIAGSFSSYNGTSRNCIARLNTDGSLDSNFNVGSGFIGNVKTTAIQTDGKIIIGGEFTSFNRVSRNNILRLNANGSLDNSFDPGTGANDIINSLISLPDGKIIIGGEFTTYNNFDKRYLARLNANGSLDESFSRINGPNGSITAIALKANGSILIAGEFGNYFNSSTERIAQLNPDGSLDRTMNLGAGPSGEYPIILNMALQSDGKIILAGRFTSYDRVAKHKIARLNANGSLDLSFNPAIGIGANIPEIYSKAIQPDGKIIIAGNFNSYNGIARNRIARLNPDGGLDTSFNPGALFSNSPQINAIAFQPNGKIIIGGYFALLNGVFKNIIQLNENGSIDSSFNAFIGSSGIMSMSLDNNNKILIGGQLRMINRPTFQYAARLNEDGSVDPTFNLTNHQGPSFNGSRFYVKSTLQLDGKAILFGSFSSYNGLPLNDIVRLNTDGSIDTSFNSLGSNRLIDDVILQPDGKIIIIGNMSYLGGDYRNQIVRLNSNGSLDSSFVPVTNSIYSVHSAALQPDGKILLGGFFNTYNPGTRDNLIRLNANGSFDVDFNYGVGPNRMVRLITLQPDGRIIIAGDFTGYNGLSTPYITRIHGNTNCSETITPTISGDTNICASNTTHLTSSSPTGNLWSTGDTTQSINVAQAGSYTVRVVNSGCTSAVSAPFRVVNAGPSPTVINFDTTSNLCLGARLQLTPAGTFAHYYWNTGERTRSIYTRTSGQYSMQVANSDSCFGLPSPPIFIAFDTNWCTVEIFRMGIDSITASVWADYYIWYLDGIELLSSNTLKTIPIQGDGVYTFRAVTAGRTSPLSNPIVITSARKSLVTKFEVYPNPATNKVTVNTSSTGTLEILNTLGQVVISQPATASNELNITHLAKGVYTVRFNGATKMLVVK